MAMRETEGSLRAYLVVAGLFAVVLGLRDISTAAKLGAILGELPASWQLAIWFPISGRICLGLGYVLAGLSLKSALPRGAGWIKTLLLIGVLKLVIDTVLIASVLGAEIGRSDLVSSVIGLLITAYLLANVRRLSDEAMAKNPPPARVA